MSKYHGKMICEMGLNLKRMNEDRLLKGFTTNIDITWDILDQQYEAAVPLIFSTDAGYIAGGWSHLRSRGQSVK